jgi:hypothetical protein
MRPWCILHRGRFFDAARWYAACIESFVLVRFALGSWMINMLTAPGLTLLFLGVVIGLGGAFVWMLWEIEQMSKSHRNSDRVG